MGWGVYRTYRVRLVVQSYLAAASIFAGWQFARFVQTASEGAAPLPVRPPGVEGYLPISGLMGLVDWVNQGVLNRIHPAATILLLIFLAVSLLLRRSFCAWICPVGLLSDALARAGQRVMGRTFRPVRAVDVILRGLKYLILAFFLYSILSMSAAALDAFIQSPYNRVSDIKMLYFFTRLGLVASVVIGVLAVASFFVHGAWCRYLCPYGALVGLLGGLSPTAVRRNAGHCIDCGRCDHVCPARLAVSRGSRVNSAECTGCLDCLATCPAPGALRVSSAGRTLTPLAFALVLVAIVSAGYLAGRMSGYWNNSISDHEYIHHIGNSQDAAYRHPGAEMME